MRWPTHPQMVLGRPGFPFEDDAEAAHCDEITDMPRIFISYRREDSPYVASEIRDRSVARFGAGSVVLDIDSIPLGGDFRKSIAEEVGRCDILIAIIGRRWMPILMERMGKADDFVRVEVAAALQRGIPVVPVLVDDASVPSAAELPPDLAELAYRNGIEVRAGRDLDQHLERLVDELAEISSARGGGDAGERSTRLRFRRVAGWLGGAVAVIVVTLLLRGGWGSTVPEGAVALDGLMWTIEDSGRDVDWQEARAYCEDLILGDTDDWALPTLGQLRSLFDPGAEYVPAGLSTPVHVQEPIRLTAFFVWSSERPDPDSASGVYFTNGDRDTYAISSSRGMRALCVRAT